MINTSFKSLKKHIQDIIPTYNQYINIYVIFFILNVTTSYIYILSYESSYMLLIRAGVTTINNLSIAFFSILVIHIFKKYTKTITYILTIIYSLFFIIELFLIINFQSLICPSILIVSSATNKEETYEFFKTYTNNWTFIGGIIIFLLCVLLAYRSKKKFIPTIYERTRHKKRNLIVLCLLLSIYAIQTFYITQVKKMTPYLTLSPLERVYYSIKESRRDRKSYQELLSYMRKDTPIIKRNQSDIQNIVLLIGESLSKTHMNCYGYPQNTTPYLNARIKNDEACIFNHIITPKTVTTEAMKCIMTFYNTESTREWYTYHSLPSVMKEAGYFTIWLSNQDNSGIFGNIPAALAQTSNKVIYTHDKNSQEESYGYFDDKLLPILKENTLNTSKNFYIIHLMGCHQRYTNRFPKTFKQFQYTDIQFSTNIHKKITIAEYDNSVLYNDYIVNEIIKHFIEKETIMIYFPDHGEEVYDSENFAGHNYVNPTKNMVEIPFIIWYSQSLQTKHPKLIKQIKQAQTNHFMTDDIIHTILDICQIQTVEFDSTRSLLHPSYNQYREFYINEHINYNVWKNSNYKHPLFQDNK